MKVMHELVSCALVSDVLDEMGYKNQMLPIDIKPNFQDARIFGKANIMSLKKISNDEDYTDVYKGIYFLETLGKGDILIVANGFSEHAFFGELMSTLAKEKGVEGVIIDGCTRDKAETIKLNYPVFARNNIARDIKKRGIVDEVDVESINLGNVIVRKGDYLLGDLDGVIVIPFEIIDLVIERAKEVYKNELIIKDSIRLGLSVDEIIRKFGEF